MNKPIRQRAISEAQKQQRLRDIVNAAKLLLAGHARLDELTMGRIATELGLTKGALYRYFPSKEALFLSIYQDTFDQIFDSLEDFMTRPVEEHQAAAVLAEHLATALPSHPLFLRLQAILHWSLEQNSERDQVLRFKAHLRTRLLIAGRMLEHYMPWLTSGQGAEVLLLIHQYSIGCIHAATPIETLIDIYEMPEYAFMKPDLTRDLRNGVLRLCLGYRSQS